MNRRADADRRVLHALWDYEYGELSLWAESGRLFASALRQRTRRPGHAHPFALGWADLRECISEIPGHHVTGLNETQYSLRLPSAGGYPLPSPPIATATADPALRGLFSSSIIKRVWQVKTVTLPGGRVLDLFISLPAMPPSGLAYGDDLLFWRDTLRHALTLAARRSFVPSIGMRLGAGGSGGNSEYVSTWEPLADDAEAEWLSEAVQRIPLRASGRR